QCSGTVVAHWVLKQWPQLALDAISQITFQMDNKHSSYPVCIGKWRKRVVALRHAATWLCQD
ncbi:hypothetical protein ONK29_25825, partial [Salmonella enterica subsp. enterica serovar Anatum]|nr:hypothetical protein [Salmonella enterica subsp. enterica serovar Anatum]